MPKRSVPPPDHRTILDLVDLIYEASLNDELWPVLLDRLAAATDSRAATLHMEDLGDRSASVAVYHRIESSFVRAFETHWASENPYVHAYVAAPPSVMHTGAVLVAERFVPDREALRTDFVNEFLLRLGVLHNIGAVVALEGKSASMLCVLRQHPGASYGPEEVGLLETILPHVQRAAAIRRRLHVVRAQASGMIGVLEALDLGVLLVDDQAKVVHANRVGEALLQRGDGVILDPDRRVSAHRTGDASRLREMIRDAACSRDVASAPPGGSLSVRRRGSERPYPVLVAPLPTIRLPGLPGIPRVAIFVGDADRDRGGIEAALGGLYGLTRTESVVAGLLLQGFRIDELGDRLAVSANTVRTHVKRIFAKVGVRGQSDLMRVVLSGPVGLLRSDS